MTEFLNISTWIALAVIWVIFILGAMHKIDRMSVWVRVLMLVSVSVFWFQNVYEHNVVWQWLWFALVIFEVYTLNRAIERRASLKAMQKDYDRMMSELDKRTNHEA